MALQKSYEDETGTTHASAYAKIAGIEMGTTDRVANVRVCIYKDAAARAADKKPVRVMRYQYQGDDYDALFSAAAMDPVDTNPIKLLYIDLKARDE